MESTRKRVEEPDRRARRLYFRNYVREYGKSERRGGHVFLTIKLPKEVYLAVRKAELQDRYERGACGREVVSEWVEDACRRKLGSLGLGEATLG